MKNSVRGEKVCYNSSFATGHFRFGLWPVKNLALLVHILVSSYWNMFSVNWLRQRTVEMFTRTLILTAVTRI